MKLAQHSTMQKGRPLMYAATYLLVILSVCMIIQVYFLAYLQLVPMLASPQLLLLTSSVDHKFNFLRFTKEEEEPMAVITVPRILWFTYETNILLTREPNLFYQNVLHTIEAYNNSWSGTIHESKDKNDFQVRFLDDTECSEIVQEAYSALSVYFAQETNGAFRGDICRAAALYLHGGYYFDVDMEVIKAYIVQDRFVPLSHLITHQDPISNLSVVEPSIFVSALNADRNRIFQSFIATTAYNPILRNSFEKMMDFYEGRNLDCTPMNDCLMGTATMLLAYEQHIQEQFTQQQHHEDSDNNTATWNGYNTSSVMDFDTSITLFGSYLLLEDKLIPELYPDFPRRPGVDNFYCNYVVHDPTTKEIYFYSRIVGSKNCPYLGDKPPPLSSTVPEILDLEQFAQVMEANVSVLSALD